MRYKLPCPTLAFESLAWLGERCGWWVQLTPCSSPPPTESKSERLSVIKAPQSWSCVCVKPCRGRQWERVFISKSHLVLFIGQSLHFKRCWEKQLCKTEVAERLPGAKVNYVEVQGKKVEEEGRYSMRRKKRVKDCEELRNRAAVRSIWDPSEQKNCNLLTWMHSTNLSLKSSLSYHAASSQIQECACRCFLPFSIF